jgi:hypothetical protein
MYADVFLMENCAFLAKFLSRSFHLYFVQASTQFEQQTAAARTRCCTPSCNHLCSPTVTVVHRYCNWLISEAFEPVLSFLKVEFVCLHLAVALNLM